LSRQEAEERNEMGRQLLMKLANGEDPLCQGPDAFAANEKSLFLAVDLIAQDGCPPNFEVPPGVRA
jgi:hypothetical protein